MVAQAGLKLKILLLQPPKYWYYRHGPLYTVQFLDILTPVKSHSNSNLSLGPEIRSSGIVFTGDTLVPVFTVFFYLKILNNILWYVHTRVFVYTCVVHMWA